MTKTIRFSALIFICSALINCTRKVSKIDETVSEQKLETHNNSSKYPELFLIIKEKDSLLFQIGFNQIDTSLVASLTSSEFEFYHDLHGVTESKNEFVKNIGSIEELPFSTWRTLLPESMEVFPLYNDNQELYGAIQNGMHEFYQKNEGESAKKTNTARFTHLWLIENEAWRLKRVLSYDHQDPK